MSKLSPRTFGVAREDLDRDDRYVRLATALSFVDLATLMGQDVVAEEALLAAAQAELLKMDKYKAPRDKLLCLVNVKTLVEDIVGAAARGGANVGGADAFFPVFLLVVIRARPQHLASNIEYVRRFRAQQRLSGQFDFMLANLESVSVYLDTVDWKHLKIPQDEFLARLADAGIPEAERELRALKSAAEGQQAQRPEPSSDLLGFEESGVPAAAPMAAAPLDLLTQDLPSAAQDTVAGVAAPVESGNAAEEPARTPLESSQADLREGAPQNEATALAALSSEIPEPAEAQAEAVLATQSEAGTTASILEGEESQTQAMTETHSAPGPAVGGLSANGAAAGPPSIDLDLMGDASPPGAGMGLTPLGGGAPHTPVLLKAKPPEEKPRESGSPRVLSRPQGPAPWAATPAEQPATRLLDSLVAEGTVLVLNEEAEGRLQVRHPWIYAAAEDLTTVRFTSADHRNVFFLKKCARKLRFIIHVSYYECIHLQPDVAALLAAYRDVVLKYEALSLVLQHQLREGSMPDGTSLADSYKNVGLGPSTAAQAVSAAAGGLLQKLTSWGRSPAGPGALDAGSEHAAALQGKSGDPSLLHTLFGSPHGNPGSGRKRLSRLDSVASDRPAKDAEGEAQGQNGKVGAVAAAVVGTSPSVAAQQSRAQTESLI